MDAHAFRCLCQSLRTLLLGARVEKIQRPTPDVHAFTVYAGGQKRFLMLRSGRQSPLLFFATHKLPAPQEPTAVVMRLRRYCAGRRVKAVRYDWLGRKIGLLMHHDPETWLVLDLRHGPTLASDFTEHVLSQDECTFDMTLLRASFDAVHTQAQQNGGQGTHHTSEPSLWRDYAFMTPALRKTLLHLAAEDPAEAAALVIDVLADMEKDSAAHADHTTMTSEAEQASCTLFVYSDENVPQKLSAWPLPMSLQSQDTQQYTERYFTNALEATTFFGQGLAFADISEDAQRVAAKPFTNEAARLQRLLIKLDGEEKRLQTMLALREDAVALQSILYQVPVDAKMSSIAVPAYHAQTEAQAEVQTEAQADAQTEAQADAQADAQSKTLSIKLNPLRTVRENMADMFHQSRRGARGLAILAQRRADIMSQEALAMHEARSRSESQGEHDDVRLLQQAAAHKQKRNTQKVLPNQKQTKNLTSAKNPTSAKNATSAKNQAPVAAKYAKLVQAFQSSDGVRLLRGRNSEGNGAVLKMAQPYDIWMHAADGPSAHLIIKRDHAQHEILTQTLEEAAQLVGVKSWQRHDAQAEIMCAYAKDVKAIKGAAAGKVRVERTFTALTVRLHDSQTPDLDGKTANESFAEQLEAKLAI
ncbi:MAG: NFACT RNA binding domain-containing protein [Pseudomonadota bacterium]